MKLLLRYRTSLGPRTVIAEIADEATAWAVQCAHAALGEESALVEEMPRISLSDHIAAHAKRRDKAALRLIASDPKVAQIGKRKKP